MTNRVILKYTSKHIMLISVVLFLLFLLQHNMMERFINLLQNQLVAKSLICSTYDLVGLRSLRALAEHNCQGGTWEYRRTLNIINGCLHNSVAKATHLLRYHNRLRRGADEPCHICGQSSSFNTDHVSTHFTTTSFEEIYWDPFRTENCLYCRRPN